MIKVVFNDTNHMYEIRMPYGDTLPFFDRNAAERLASYINKINNDLSDASWAEAARNGWLQGMS